ncbi:hypothetical protein PsYK624_069550 [Phanerochaete sordida]|uniref:DUF4211 domain-containing protein n=1 Tax=Phanerochaete sordida TaxID=48140 RepID=A0A9P3G9R2_9APHY|nr:hypothetical protein PsYK624_069550 [Phanerochaete sordida]
MKPKGKKVLKQMSLTEYLGSSSPPPEPSSSKKAKPPPSPAKPANRKRAAASKRRAPESDAPSDDDSGSTSSNVGGIAFEPEVIDISTSDEDVDDSPKRPPATQRKTRKRRAESTERSPVVVHTDSDDEEVGVPVTWKGKGKAAGKRKRAVVDSDDENPRPRKSKLVKGVRPPTPETAEENLADEVEEERILESRLRTRDKRSEYQKNLDKLRRKKRGEVVASESSTSGEEEEEEDNGIIPGARPTHEMSSDASEEEPEDEGLSGFIEEDSNQAIELPVEFSMNTYQDLMHHFKIICQLFVHLAVQPVDERREYMDARLKQEYFSVPLQVARRKITGMRDSLVTSSVWRTEFKKPLEMHPEFETVQMEFAVPQCDACHLGGRVSTLTGRCFGDPYDRKTFEALSESDISDDEESPLKKEFNLGRFCARRTRVFHKFTHWEYHLFEALNQEVQDLRNRTGKRRVFVPVAYAGGAKPPDDLSDGDGIMAWLDERGMIGNEWQKIKDMMENARHLEVASKRGEDDD